MVVLFVGGVAGGAMSGAVRGPLAVAQNPPPRVIKAQEFQVVDGKGEPQPRLREGFLDLGDIKLEAAWGNSVIDVRSEYEEIELGLRNRGQIALYGDRGAQAALRFARYGNDVESGSLYVHDDAGRGFTCPPFWPPAR